MWSPGLHPGHQSGLNPESSTNDRRVLDPTRSSPEHGQNGEGADGLPFQQTKDMAKRIEIDGVFYRKRRGKLVKIPDEWVGHTVAGQKIAKRHSKTGIKKIESRQKRAEDQDAMVQGEEPNPHNRRTLKRWWYSSGRVDKHRNKFRNQRIASHPSNKQTKEIQMPES